MVTNFCWAAAGALPRAATAAKATEAASATGRRRVVKRVDRFMLQFPLVVGSVAGTGVHRLERPVDRALEPDDDLVDLVLRHDERGREQHMVAAAPVDGASHRLAQQAVLHGDAL